MTKHLKILEVWKDFKDKLRTTLNHLRTRNNPEVIALENQILAKMKEMETNSQERVKLDTKQITSGKSTPDSSLPEKIFSQRANLDEQWTELKKQKEQLLFKLEGIQPFFSEFRKNLDSKENQIEILNNMLKEAQSLAVQHSTQKYDEHVQSLQNNYESVLKKLDRVRNLVADNNLESLKNLVKKGQI